LQGKIPIREQGGGACKGQDQSESKEEEDQSEVAMAGKLRHFDFEVFGIVQGVFFRKFTQKEAVKLQLVGWVKNTRNDTVVGQCQGKEEQVDLMKRWLSQVGSPSSRIDKCDIKNEKDITAYDFTKFEIRH